MSNIIIPKKIEILQPNQIGYGILVEYDAGVITPELNSNILSESYTFEKDEPIYINCILQKWGVRNKNGRIYPKDVLIKEINRYSDIIANQSSTGESDHPDCVCASESMICTKDGWKNFEDISDDEEILTLNTITNKIEVQQITKKIYEKFKGKMYSFKSKNSFEITVTPNHRFLLENSKGERLYYTAKEIYDNVNNIFASGKYKILKTGEWEGKSYSNFTLKGVDRSKLSFNLKKTLIEKYTEDIQINAEDWFAFLGIYLSDGHSCGVISKKENSSGYDVVITQKKPHTQKMIEELLNRLPFKHYIIEYSDGKKQYHIHDARLYNYLYPLGSSKDKYIPIEIKESSKDLLEVFFKWFLIGDGRTIKSFDKIKKQSVFSTSKKLIYDLKEILLKIGGSGNITEYLPNDRLIGERVIKQENSSLQYNLNISFSSHIYLDKRFIKINEIDFDDNIACVTVPNSNFYVMVNGKSHWTGNSSIISLHNISHLVTKMWWGSGENENVLYGKLRLVVSKGFLKYGIVSVIGDKILLYLQNGIKIGISSRGVGSLKEVRGENLVQDDFELVCFDLVSSPSTFGAYLFPEETTFSKVDTKTPSLSENKIIDRFNKFLLK